MAVPAAKRRRENEDDEMEETTEKPKGKGKSGKGPRDGCFNCGGDHYASKCPKGKGKGKDQGKGGGKDFGGKGKGKQNWFPQKTWNQFYPGPSPSTWNSWYPYGGKGGGKSGPKGGKSGVGFMGEAMYTPDGQAMVFPPLGNVAQGQDEGWWGNQDWGLHQQGQLIGGLTKKDEEFEEVKAKKPKKFVRF